jgi:serine/threonine-protein kinase HipA
MPRHFLQTAELAGVGTPLMRTIFEDLAANAEKQTDAVINALPRGFPDQLVTSVRAAVKNRAGLLANAPGEAAALNASGDA